MASWLKTFEGTEFEVVGGWVIHKKVMPNNAMGH